VHTINYQTLLFVIKEMEDLEPGRHLQVPHSKETTRGMPTRGSWNASTETLCTDEDEPFSSSLRRIRSSQLIRHPSSKPPKASGTVEQLEKDEPFSGSIRRVRSSQPLRRPSSKPPKASSIAEGLGKVDSDDNITTFARAR